MNTTDRKPYPAMVNVGMVTKAQLQALVSKFPDRHFTVTRGELVYKVRDMLGVEVLSAAIIRPDAWHIRACDGLVKRVT